MYKLIVVIEPLQHNYKCERIIPPIKIIPKSYKKIAIF